MLEAPSAKALAQAAPGARMQTAKSPTPSRIAPRCKSLALGLISFLSTREGKSSGLSLDALTCRLKGSCTLQELFSIAAPRQAGVW